MPQELEPLSDATEHKVTARSSRELCQHSVALHSPTTQKPARLVMARNAWSDALLLSLSFASPSEVSGAALRGVTLVEALHSLAATPMQGEVAPRAVQRAVWAASSS